MAVVETLPGYIKLLGAILEEVEWDDLWAHFGLLPPGTKRCLDCGKPIPEQNKGGRAKDYCQECYEKRHYVILECYQCGGEFKLTRSEYDIRLRHRKVPFFFCNKHCYGMFVGETYGFITHPENIGTYPKKWDYGKVYKLWENTHWSHRKISEALDIPRPTITTILNTFEAYRNRNN